MQVLLIVFALILLTLVYNFGVPRFSRGLVGFGKIGIFARFACVLLLTVTALPILVINLIGLAFATAVFFKLAGWSILEVPYSALQFAVELVLYLCALQVAHTLSIRIVGKFFPTMMRVSDSNAAFHAALLPTVYGCFAYAMVLASFF